MTAFPVRFCRTRLAVVVIGLSIAFVALGLRLFHIQVVDHARYVAHAERMHVAPESTDGYRGDIYTTDGVLLARDSVSYRVGVDPRPVSPEHLPEVVRIVCQALGTSEDYRARCLRQAIETQSRNGGYVSLGKRVHADTVEEIREALSRAVPHGARTGLAVESEMWRRYPRKSFAANVVGVTNIDGEGREGIEYAMESYLSPRGGQRTFLVDARPERNKMFQLDNLFLEPVQAYDVHLTIDSRVQAIVEEELEAGILADQAESGLAVVMDCRSGDILAMASYPPYDPGRFGDYPEEERARRRRNAVVESAFEPGSVMKPFFAARALESGVCGRQQPIRSLQGARVSWDGGKTAKIGYRRVHDTHEHDDMTVEEVVRYSSNIGMAILGLRMGQARLQDALEQFGFGSRTGIQLPAEASGSVPTKWKPLDECVSVSFGYAVAVTPLQLCRAFASLVNGGYLLRPRIVDRLTRGSEVHQFPNRVVDGRPISEETSATMREILRGVVEEGGTGRFLKLEGFSFGAKTGTAILLQKNGKYKTGDYLSSFEAFAPFDDPEIVMVCMIEKPRGKYHYGSWVAGPIVVDVIRRLYDIDSEPSVKRYKNGS